MRRMHFALSTGAILLAAIAADVMTDAAKLSAQGGFEGVVTFEQYDHEGKPEGTMVQTTKGKKLRISGMGHGDRQNDDAMIFDGDTKSMMMVNSEEKKAILLTQQDAEQMRGKVGAMAHAVTPKKTADTDDWHVQFASAGRSETIAAVRCEVWHGSSEHKGKKEEGEVCIANGVGFAMFGAMTNSPMLMGNPSGNSASQFAKFGTLVGNDKGILKVVRIENGKPVTELEATSVRRTPVSDASFTAPPGYQVVTMSEMMQQMREGMQKMHTPQGKPPR